MPREWPVQPRWRLLRVILFQSVILSFYPLGLFSPRRTRGDRDMPHASEAAMFKAGEHDGVQIPPRGSDQSRKAIRVQVPSGSFNARQRRELAYGDMCDRVVTGLGDRSKKSGCE